jgi:hypothetical protein
MFGMGSQELLLILKKEPRRQPREDGLRAIAGHSGW